MEFSEVFHVGVPQIHCAFRSTYLKYFNTAPSTIMGVRYFLILSCLQSHCVPVDWWRASKHWGHIKECPRQRVSSPRGEPGPGERESIITLSASRFYSVCVCSLAPLSEGLPSPAFIVPCPRSSSHPAFPSTLLLLPQWVSHLPLCASVYSVTYH